MQMLSFPLPFRVCLHTGLVTGIHPGYRPGMRVTVQFGRRKIYTALVRRLHDVKPAAYEVKGILSVLDDEPVVNERQFLLWEWISDYYMCTLGEVFKAALPSGLKLESETRVMATGSACRYSRH